MTRSDFYSVRLAARSTNDRNPVDNRLIGFLERAVNRPRARGIPRVSPIFITVELQVLLRV